MVGNFIGDHVRSKDLQRFDLPTQFGVRLHWDIDQFTDNHPVVMQSKMRLRPKYRKYSPVVVDIFYDHFLSKNWNTYHKTPLLEFSQQFFDTCNTVWESLPASAQHMLPYMQKHQWLIAYGDFEGLGHVFNGMSRRASFQSKMEGAVQDLQNHYEAYSTEFETFFPELITFSKNRYSFYHNQLK